MAEARTAPNASQLAAILGLAGWQLRLALEQGMLPQPDLEEGRWSAALVQDCERRAGRVLEALGDDPPIGAVRAAARVAERVGLDVDRADIEALVVSGRLTMAGHYQDYPLYALRDLDALDGKTVTKVVAARKGPLFESVDGKAAAGLLGWPKEAFDRIAAERGLPTDQLNRYTLADVQHLAADQDLRRVVEEEQRKAALRSARKDVDRAEQKVRHWLQRCANYLGRTDDESPDAAEIRRALKALAAARAEADLHEPPADP